MFPYLLLLLLLLLPLGASKHLRLRNPRWHQRPRLLLLPSLHNAS